MDTSEKNKRLDQRCEATKADIRKELRRLRTPAYYLEDLTEEVFWELVRSLLEESDSAADPRRQEIDMLARKARARLRSGVYKWEILGVDMPRLALQSVEPEQEERVLVAEVLQCRELRPEDREVLWLAFFEGLTNREIAARLQKTENAVSGIRHRAIQQAAAFVGTHRGRLSERKRHVVPVARAPEGAPATHRWSARLGSGMYGWSTAVDRDGSLILVGWLAGPAVFGGARLESGDAWPWKLWLVRVRRDQEIAKVVCLAGATQQHGQSITLHDDGHLIVAAYFTDSLQFADEAPVSSSSPGRMAVLLAKIELTAFRAVWARTHLAGSPGQHDHSLVIDARGNIVVAGLVRVPDTKEFILIIRRFDRDGYFLKGWEYLHTGEYWGWAVAAAGSGLLVTGAYEGSIDFRSGQHKHHRKQEFFLAKLDASGECEWLQSYGGTGGQHGWSTCVDALGSISIAGYFEGTIDFGNRPLRSKRGSDVFVARLDASGKHVWSASFPGAAGAGRSRGGSAQEGSAPPSGVRAHLGLSVATGPDGGLFLAGNFDPGACSGTGPLPGAAEDDILLAKFDGNGTDLWCVSVGRGADAWFGNEIAADATGGVVLSVYIQGSVTLGQQLHPANCDELDLCVANFR